MKPEIPHKGGKGENVKESERRGNAVLVCHSSKKSTTGSEGGLKGNRVPLEGEKKGLGTSQKRRGRLSKET